MPKIVDHEAYRRELLERCFALLAERSYSAVSMREIARHLGVSTGTVYHYFSDKEDLFRQVLRHVADADMQLAVDELLQVADPSERLDLLFAFVRRRQDHLRHFLLLVLDFHRQMKDPEQLAEVRQVLGAYQSAIQEHLSLPAPVAKMLLNLVLGTLLHCLLQSEEGAFEEELEMVRQLLLQSGVSQVA